MTPNEANIPQNAPTAPKLPQAVPTPVVGSGDDFIKQREHLAAQYMDMGLSGKSALSAANAYLTKDYNNYGNDIAAAAQRQQGGSSATALQQQGTRLPRDLGGAKTTPYAHPQFADSQAAGTGPFNSLASFPGLAVDELTKTQGNQEFLTTAAGLIDAAESLITKAKPLDVRTTESALDTSTTMIKNDIELVRNGLMTREQAYINFAHYQLALSKLEQTNRGLGKANLRYWQGGGLEVETDILNYKELIDNLAIQLDQADLQAQTAKVTASFDPNAKFQGKIGQQPQ